MQRSSVTARMPGLGLLVTGLPKCLLRAATQATGAAFGAAAACVSSSVLNQGVRLHFDHKLPLMLEVSYSYTLLHGIQDDWHIETVLVDPQTLG